MSSSKERACLRADADVTGYSIGCDLGIAAAAGAVAAVAVAVVAVAAVAAAVSVVVVGCSS